MTFVDRTIPAPRNRLLAALPPDALAQFWPKLTPVDLALRQILHEPSKPIETIYFHETGWTSMIAYLEDGDAIEVGLVGREGFVGLPVLLGGESDDLEAMVQAPGTALTMDANSLRAELDRNPALRTLLLRYTLVHHGVLARVAACNGSHQIEQRLARWLLMGHDRAEGDTYPMTHEFLSMMLGVRRAGVSVAAGILQKAQLIRYERGVIEVTDRPGLENASCECYGAVRRSFDALFAYADTARTGGDYRR